MGKIVRRMVATSFWEDNKVIDKFSVEDKYFMLYLMTNPHTTQAGIYKLPYRMASFETGYNTDVIKVLLDRFQNKYHVIIYSKETQEIAVLNSLKYSIIKGGKPVSDCVISDLENIEDSSLIQAVYEHLSAWWERSSRSIDHTIENVFLVELEKRKEPKEIQKHNDKHKHNHKHNDNEESYHESYHESLDYHDINDSDTSKKSNAQARSANLHNLHLSLDQLSDEFESIWVNYPKKKGKKVAFNHYKAWRKASPIKHTPEYLIKRLEAYNRQLKIDHTADQYILNGATWFNGRFDDELGVDKIQPAHGGFNSKLFDGNLNVNEDDLPF